MIKTKTIDVKADNGIITGYASTWIREPDTYGDVVAKGAFEESIAQIKAEGKILPLLFNHKGDDLAAYIGGIYELHEDDHGLYFEGAFDGTPEAQRARELSKDGRLAKFSFAYDVLDQGEVTLEDGRKANELRKLNIHEISLVLYPANRDTSVLSVKSEPVVYTCGGVTVGTAPSSISITSASSTLPNYISTTPAYVWATPAVEVKDGRRNSAKDAEDLRKAISLIQGVLGELDDKPEESKAKAEEPDTANAEELMKNELLERAKKLLEE